MPVRNIRLGAFNDSLDNAVAAWLAARLPETLALYKDLHAHPELSSNEKRTSGIMAHKLRVAGAKVITHIGGYGVTGVVRNGAGPTVLVRADMDALPIDEETGLPYASRMKGVMHACGHDVHMAALASVAAVMIQTKSAWSGTIVFVCQPAEETAAGAVTMVRDGLWKRVPRPNVCVALHVETEAAAGQLALTPGWASANTDSVDVVIHGKGGHGALPHRAEDPIVAAAQVITALQTIVTRRVDPMEPVVITVGSIHAGQKHNIIPDKALLQLTVRTFSKTTRKKVLKSIETVVADAARAAGCSTPPDVNVGVEYTAAMYNDPRLCDHARRIFANIVRPADVLTLPPTTGGEDFSVYMDTLGVPGLMFSVGAVEPRAAARARHGKSSVPLHNSRFFPLPEPTLKIAVRSMCALVASLLKERK